jgi:hypothetical protein
MYQFCPRDSALASDHHSPDSIRKRNGCEFLNGWDFDAFWKIMNQGLRGRFGIAENGDTSVLAKIVQSGIAKSRNYAIMEFSSYTSHALAIRFDL